MTHSFKALRVHASGSGTEARLETITLDDLTPGEVVVRVAWSGLNFKDALAVTGKSKIMRDLPRVAGIDFSGIVEDSSDARYKKGDAVLVTGNNIGELFDGGLTEYARVAADSVVPLPAGLSLREVMAIGTAGFTAGLALHRMLENHQAPELGPIAVNGATGGVGSIAITLLKGTGFSPTAITGKPSSEAYLRGLGAEAIFDRRQIPASTRPLEKAIWGGAIDNLGGDNLAYLARTMRPWGNIAAIGLAQSHELHTTVMPFILRGVSLLGINSVDVPRPWRMKVWEQLAGAWKIRDLEKRIVAREISLDEVPAACKVLMAAEMQGRVLVRLAGG